MNHQLLRHALAFVLLAGMVLAPGTATGADNPTAWEQWLLSDINRARWDPYGYAAENGLNSSGWPSNHPTYGDTRPMPNPPLAFNPQLESAAGAKAYYMAGGGTMDSKHCTPGPVCPNRLAKDHGYPLESWWPLNENMIEVFWSGNGAGTPGFGADLFMASDGHRPMLFRWGDREDGGVGWSDRCPRSDLPCNFVIVHAGSRSPFATQITGFVYNDSDGDGIMDFGEGLSGVTVSAGSGYSAITGTGGAYSIVVPDDRGYTITASGGGFSPTASARACVTGNNLGVDFRDLGSSSAPVVHGFPGRIEGANRYETAASIARCSHPSPFPSGQGVVYVGTGTNYPDALAAAPAAAAENAPILLTDPNNLPPSTQTELDRLHPKTIVILGGPAAISDFVVNTLKTRYPGSVVVRRYGDNRYDTSAAITAGAFPGTVDTVYITTGENYPDALMAGAPAAAEGGALLLTRPTGLPGEVAAEIARLDPDRIIVIGTTTAVPASVISQLDDYAPVTRIANNDRFAQSAAVSLALLPTADVAYIATGNNFPDALAAGPLAALMKGSILLVGTSLASNSAVAVELERLNPTSITVFGGYVAVPDAVVAVVRNYLEWK